MEIPLQKVIAQVKSNKDVKLLKKISDDKNINDESWANVKDVCEKNYSDKPDFKESELQKRFFNSIGAKTFYDPKDLKKIAPSIIKQYVCLKKNYGLRYDIEPEFLTEKEFYKKYPNEEENYDPLHLSFMQSLMNKNYDYRLAVQKDFSKCIKKSEVDW